MTTASNTQFGCACNAEPLPAACSQHDTEIQPHGVLLVLSEPQLTVAAVSDNAAAILGIDCDRLCGSPFVQLLDPVARPAVAARLAQRHAVNPLELQLGVPGQRLLRPFVAAVHRDAGSALIVEIEPGQAPHRTRPSDAIHAAIDRLQAATDTGDLLFAAADAIRAHSGFRSVAVVRFGAGEPGTAISEAAIDKRSGGLGDIVAAVRLDRPPAGAAPASTFVPDTAYIPAHLRAGQQPFGMPIDLSHAVLRSVGPALRAVCQRDGTRALLTIEIAVDGGPWGCIVGRHPATHRMAPAARSECELIAHMLAWQLTSRLESERRRFVPPARAAGGTRVQGNGSQAALSELQADVAAALPSRAAVASVVLAFAQRQTGADGSALESLTRDEVVCEAASGVLAPAAGSRVARAGSYSGLAADRDESLACDDVAGLGGPDAQRCAAFGICSLVVVPVAISGDLTLIVKAASTRAGAFGAAGIETLRVAARTVQDALRSAYEGTPGGTAELEQRVYARALRALHAIASTTTSNRKDQIDAALRLGLEQLGLEFGFLGVFDFARQEFAIESTVSRGGRAAVPEGARLPLAHCVLGRVALARGVVIAVGDELNGGPAPAADWTACIAVPLSIGGTTYGAVGFVSREVGREPFSQADIEFLAVAGELIASVIERGRQREQLQSSQTRYSALIEAIPQMVWVVDGANGFQYVNARWTDYTGLTLGQSRAGAKDVYHRGDLAAAGFDDTPLPRTQFDVEVRLRRHDGVYRWHLVRSLPFHRSGGDVDMWLVTGTDIEERKSAEAILADVHDAAVAAAEAKSRFLATMSHEIRTPMNGVIGMTELLLLTSLSDEQREYIEIVRDSGQSLLRVLNDILDYSKIEAGKLELETVQFDLPGQIESVVELMRPGYTAKSVELTTQIAPGVPAAVLGDPGRLRQILLNLAGNALKFTPSGGSVRIDVAAAPADGTIVPVRFTIVDTGIGIPTHVVNRLFRPFSQGDESTTRKYGGTGLGLSISAELVTLMGGEIGVESVPGRGSTFWFAIPFSCASHAPTLLDAPKRARARTEPTALRTDKILLVEDNEINTFLALKQLRRLGFAAQAVENGREAVAAVTGERFDLVLMDCHMPEMDGFEATREIRKRLSGLLPRLPIVAMTADARDEDHENCLRAGMDDYISKPTNLEGLRAILDRWLPAPERRRASRNGAPLDSAPIVGMTMLLDLFDGNRTAVLDLLAAARRSIQADTERIERAAAQRDLSTIVEAAHRLKGTSGSIRSGRLVEIGAAIEHEAKTNAAGPPPRLLAELRGAVNAVAVEIERQSPGTDTSLR